MSRPLGGTPSSHTDRVVDAGVYSHGGISTRYFAVASPKRPEFPARAPSPVRQRCFAYTRATCVHVRPRRKGVVVRHVPSWHATRRRPPRAVRPRFGARRETPVGPVVSCDIARGETSSSSPRRRRRCDRRLDEASGACGLSNVWSSASACRDQREDARDDVVCDERRMSRSVSRRSGANGPSKADGGRGGARPAPDFGMYTFRPSRITVSALSRRSVVFSFNTRLHRAP